MKFISLFSGIGGLDLGLELAGWECVAQVEKDKYCRRVLAKHWPAVPRFEDVRNVGRDNLPTADAIVGGFPCQPHSYAGQRRGAADDRNLWPEYLRIVTELHPAWVVGENVPGLRTTMLDDIISDLEAANYAVATFDIPAIAFDARHVRHRLFVVAHRENEGAFGGQRVAENGAENGGEWGAVGGRSKGYVGGESVAYSDRAGQRKQRRPVSVSPEYLAAQCGGEGLGHAASAGLPDRTTSAMGEPGAQPQPERPSRAGEFWATEPDVGRVAHGIPSALDGTIRRFGYENIDHKEAIAKIDSARRQVLRDMWDIETFTEASPDEGQPRRNDFVSAMPHVYAHERWNLGQRVKKDEELRDMWDTICSKPFQETQDLQQDMLERVRAQERNEKVASSRVDRLRGLGNAVVPQVAEFVGRMILESEL